MSQATTPAGPAPAAGRRCQHTPVCPEADAPDRDAARVVRTHPDQGWSLLCNGVILFEDTGEILPSGRIIEPRRVPPKITSTGRSRSPRPPAPRRAPTTVPVVTAGV
ncbi:MAG: hypothetical protein IRZ08_10120 [Frankia sp.]|nr:hypothetical protein [Frankia sp.]